MPTEPPQPLISKWAADNRILPSNTPFPGAWDNSKTPYLIKIMDGMAPGSAIQHSAVMKGVQLGLTAACENIIGYYIKENPTEIVYVTATGILLDKWATKRLEPMIDSCGIRPYLRASVETAKSRRTGDRVLSKAFIGGNLNMVSAQSASSLRSDSVRLLIRDEIDGAPKNLTTGEGDWVAVSEARTIAWGDRRKILDISTPTLMDSSRMFTLYEAGDQQHLFVPCPHCGKFQVLEWGNEESKHGFKAETKAGVLEHAYYLCDYCHDAILNHHKTEMLIRSEWRPTAKSCEPEYESYYLPSYYSPVGMLSWTRLWRYYMQAQEEPDGMRSFTNLYMGLPYKESGQRPKLANVIQLRGGYKQGTVPRGVLYLTLGVDVQTGSAKDEKNPPRLELEVMGIGAGYKTWSITYRQFLGSVEDPYSGAWEDMYDWAMEGGLTFKRDDGRGFNVAMAFIDSGDGNVTDIVYRFCERWDNTYPSKGFGDLKRRKIDKNAGDQVTPDNARRHRAVRLNSGTQLLEISTNYYKRQLYTNLKIARQPDDPQNPGFCDFPVDYPDSYFQALTAEGMRPDKSFYCPSGRRNEALDCRVMCQCAAEFWLDQKLWSAKGEAKNRGASISEIDMIRHRDIIDLLVRTTK